MAKAKVLTKQEIRTILRIAEMGRNGLRDRTALSLSILAGMRVGEVAALTINDVRGLEGKAVSVINLTRHQTKGNRARRVFVSDDLRKTLDQYLATITDLDGSRALIRSSRTGRHFSSISLSLRFKAIYAQAGISTSSHSGRRTFASALSEKGIGIRTIQHLLGHANIQTTALYVEVRDDQMANAVNAI